MNDVSVRVATAADAAELVQVHVAAWRVGYGNALPPGALDAYLDEVSYPARVLRWQLRVADGSVRVALLPRSDLRGYDVVGFVQSGPSRDNPHDWHELQALYVHPDVWGLGVGSALLNTLPNFPTELWVLEVNERARRFYHRHGFVANGDERVHMIGSHDLVKLRYQRWVKRRRAQ